MKNKTIVLSALLLMFIPAAAFAVSSGMVLEFSGTPMGKVVFDGKVHKDAGLSCKDCHNQEMFPAMKQGTVQITMEDIYAGRLCGVCHNGERAFGTEGNCNRCHIK